MCYTTNMEYEKNNDLTGKSKEALDSVGDFNFKDRWGQIPKSIMKFKKTKELMELIDWDSSELGQVEGEALQRGHGYAKNLRYSIYNPDQAFFILDYYTKENDLILDPFMGRATRPLVTRLLNRRYIGFDTSRKTFELNTRLLTEKFPDFSKWVLYHGDGTELKNMNEQVDAVFSCPPYLNIEKYSGEEGDLSVYSESEFWFKIEKMFDKLYTIIKTSNYEKREFYPVIFTVGSIRKGMHGLIDMDRIFQNIALKTGFVLHDKLLTENNTPGAGFTFRRNYAYKFLTKNYETTLVFIKY